MRITIVGAGLAGSLLAWRLATLSPGLRVDLITGPSDGADATAASGGLVRGFEVDPAAAVLAAASLAELVADPRLRAWSQYQEVGSFYLCGADVRRADLDRLAPATAQVVPGASLPDWAGLPEGSHAVVERAAGYFSPAALRRAVLDALPGLGVAVRRETVGLVPGAGAHDVVVLAAGAGTVALLAASGLPDGGFRRKHIQYGLYAATGTRPPSFIDDLTGLYGRPTPDGGMLLGVPSESWDPADRPVAIPALQRQAERLAAARLPRLRLGALRRTVVGVDCYGPDGHLTLRPLGSQDGLYTFTGGSGGSAKTALAASLAAARHLSSARLPQSAGISHSLRREVDECQRSL
ncbi:NAD(P)/FAD-dependent oxidoreductase [Dactylosporangium matsuzakiense]|nr:FAD-dependent oxidoreductase [Dactylosporangium matsuzakiense]UWZ42825.1 FAD-binding oxidoreductase [Dactylosporangium matsuzakiense]